MRRGSPREVSWNEGRLTAIDPSRLLADVSGHIDPDALTDLAAGLVRFRSAAPEEGPIGRFLADWMRATDAFDEVLLQRVVSDRSNVIGVVRGSGKGPNVVLNGHLDQAEPRAGWTRDPYEPVLEDGWLYGMGLTDMKAAIACQVLAAVAIAQSDVRHRGDIVTTSVMYHDTVGLGTKFFLDSWEQPIHAAICGEPTSLAVQTAHGGAWQFEVAVETPSRHVSRAHASDGAIQVTIDLLSRLRTENLTYDRRAAFGGLPKIVVGVIDGGWRPARTADRCVVRGDIRTLPSMTARTLREDFDRLFKGVALEHPEAAFTLTELAYQRPFQVEANSAIVEVVADSHAAVTGERPVFSRELPVSAYVTDSSDFARVGIPTVLYGPGDWTAEPDERIAVDELLTAAKVYAVTAATLSA